MTRVEYWAARRRARIERDAVKSVERRQVRRETGLCVTCGLASDCRDDGRFYARCALCRLREKLHRGAR